MRAVHFTGGSHVLNATLPADVPPPAATLSGFDRFFVRFPEVRSKEVAP